MRGLVFHGPDQFSWEEVNDPAIEHPMDAILRVGSVTLCGTDLHILKGDVPEVVPGTVLGHEAVGEVVETGLAVQSVRVGDRVLESCMSACGLCRFCREAAYSQCRNGGGWNLGHLIHGTQAEYVRVPFADLSVHVLPANLGNRDAVLFCDVLPTAYEVGILNGRVRPGDTVVIVGPGPIGLASIITAKLFSPRQIVVVGRSTPRLEAASSLGADHVVLAHEAPEDLVNELTDGLGADVVIEAVGIPETFELCTRLVRPGGNVANVGVHGSPALFHLEDLWPKNVTIRTGLVDTYSTPQLLAMSLSGHLDVSSLVTHTFPLDRIMDAYDVFSRPQETRALKVVLHRDAEDPVDENGNV